MDYSLKTSISPTISPNSHINDLNSIHSLKKLRNLSPKRSDSNLNRIKLIDNSPAILNTPIKESITVSPATTPRKHTHLERRVH
jgi:hypothetical protein